MSFDSGFFQQLKIVNRSLQIGLADTVDCKTDAVLTGIKNSVLAGTVVLELEQNVTVVKRKNVLCFTFVNLFHSINPFNIMKIW